MDKNSKHIYYTEYTFSENRDFYEIIWKKYCGGGQATDENMAHCALHAGYLSLQTYTQNM
jgi:hypothetical protein